MMGKDALNPKPPKIWASRAFPLQTRPNHEARETSPAFLTRHSPSNSCLSVQFFMSSRAHHNPIASSEGKILSDTSQIDIMNYAAYERGAHELLIDSWAFQSLELEQLLGFPTLYCTACLMGFLVHALYSSHTLQNIFHWKQNKRRELNLMVTAEAILAILHTHNSKQHEASMVVVVVVGP